MRLRVLTGIEEAQAEIAHQPFVAGAGREIDAARLHVDGNASGRMNDVGVDERAVRMRRVADRFQIMLEPVDRRDEGERDEALYLCGSRV